MSTKLVKKQLNSLIEQHAAHSEGKAVPASQKAKEKRRQASLKKKQKQLQKEVEAQRSERQVLKKNLKYFKDTKGPSGASAELMGKLLASVTSAKK
ncbi:hypothetical protein PLESTB_000702500 [Pleodorina starrii]|uniref:Uncharacterized protein n=1 Tax=Pleodorina starrii TaxID=330485 RepID=A0A9W6BJ27_9CHLO|nr:hypothetical protein PLESTB_000702500 [Pleodorina starrii]